MPRPAHLNARAHWFVLSLIWLVAGCDFSSDTPAPASLDLTQPWVKAAPAAVGIAPAGLSAAVSAASAQPRMLSLLVVRDGMLVLEEYFHGNDADSLNDVRSVTKSIVSTLVGVALKEGFIGSLDETLGDHLQEQVELLSPGLQAISVRHLLTMTSGFEWDESGGPAYGNWIRAQDHVGHLLDQPLVHEAGTTFTYNSAAVHLLGVLLQEAVEMPLPDFADRYLFSKIGIQRSRWEALTGGYVNAGAGLDLRPRDLARLGQLYLQAGQSGDTQVLPTDWVAAATTPRFTWRSDFGPLAAFTYGYLWWVEEGQAEPGFFAWGYGGQFIYVVPSLDLVVVATTNWRSLSLEGGAAPLEQAVLDLILNHIVPAAR